ncbi:hypothetical protein BHM03_00058846 [Ensete ventricosum]|uniref:Uncharacterized protein n=1 Tax=Ensete ventricosum TaxID=4639 RepID=A0A445MML5_ENSVE|nr:hypothetical protein BHM03_00058846 [Ensete ventricosum]
MYQNTKFELPPVSAAWEQVGKPATRGKALPRHYHASLVLSSAVGMGRADDNKNAGSFTTAYEERGSEQDEREVGYSPRGEEAPSGAPTGKKGHRERLTMVETRLDVLEASVEELYQSQGRLLAVESLQEEA